MPFELLRSESLMKGRAFTIRRDTLKTPDGRETKFDIVEHGGSVIIILMDADGNLLFVRQYRHAAGMDMLELPAGTRDGDEPFEECAAREIREETGMEAGRLDPCRLVLPRAGLLDRVHGRLPGNRPKAQSARSGR
jgi:ADP-ribose pyrophosphatase